MFKQTNKQTNNTSCYILLYIVLNYTFESYSCSEICFYEGKAPNTYFKLKALFFSFKIRITRMTLQGNVHCSVVTTVCNKLFKISQDNSLRGRCDVYFYNRYLCTGLQMLTLALQSSVEQEPDLQTRKSQQPYCS